MRPRLADYSEVMAISEGISPKSCTKINHIYALSFLFSSHLSNFVPCFGRKKTAAANLSVYQSKTEKFIAAVAIRKCFQSTLYSYSILISAALSMDFSCITRQYLFYRKAQPGCAAPTPFCKSCIKASMAARRAFT